MTNKDIVEYRMWDKEKQEMLYWPIVDEYKSKVDEDDDRYIFMRCTLHRDILGTKAYVWDILKHKDSKSQIDSNNIKTDKYSYIYYSEKDGLCISDPFNNRWGNLKAKDVTTKIVVWNRFENPNVYNSLKNI